MKEKEEDVETKLMFRSFGKCSRKTTKRPANIEGKQEVIEGQKKAAYLLDKQMKRVDKDIEKAKAAKTGIVGQIFLRVKAMKGRSTCDQAIAIKHALNGMLGVDKGLFTKYASQKCGGRGVTTPPPPFVSHCQHFPNPSPPFVSPVSICEPPPPLLTRNFCKYIKGHCVHE